MALACGHLVSPDVAAALSQVGAEAMERTFWPVLLIAVFAGWMIALMVWLLPGASAIKLLLIVFGA